MACAGIGNRGLSMGIAVSVTLASLFLFLCGFNLWNMLRGTSTRNAKLWVQVHRACGYAFIAVFIIFVYFMLLRIKGPSDELPPRLILHVAMAFALAPLLLIKVMVARYQKAARGLLTALGVAIFVIAVTLVSLNLAIHFLSHASPQKVGYRTSAAVVVAVLLSLATAFYFPGRRPEPNAGENPVTVSGGKASRRSSEVFTLTLARIETQTHDAKTLRFALARGQRRTARAVHDVSVCHRWKKRNAVLLDLFTAHAAGIYRDHRHADGERRRVTIPQ